MKTITRDLSRPRVQIPPGEILLEEFLKPANLTQVDAAGRMGIPLNRLNEIVRGRRTITADTALRLAALFNMSPEFWMSLQASWDLHQARLAMRKAGEHTDGCQRPAGWPAPGAGPRRGAGSGTAWSSGTARRAPAGTR